jgi:hypothetical protein
MTNQPDNDLADALKPTGPDTPDDEALGESDPRCAAEGCHATPTLRGSLGGVPAYYCDIHAHGMSGLEPLG